MEGELNRAQRKRREFRASLIPRENARELRDFVQSVHSFVRRCRCTRNVRFVSCIDCSQAIFCQRDPRANAANERMMILDKNYARERERERVTINTLSHQMSRNLAVVIPTATTEICIYRGGKYIASSHKGPPRNTPRRHQIRFSLNTSGHKSAPRALRSRRGAPMKMTETGDEDMQLAVKRESHKAPFTRSVYTRKPLSTIRYTPAPPGHS